MITANQVPDHATIARFRVRHQEALAELFGHVLGRCTEAGLVGVAVLAVDGSNSAPAASDSAIRTFEELARDPRRDGRRRTRPRMSVSAPRGATSCSTTSPSDREGRAG